MFSHLNNTICVVTVSIVFIHITQVSEVKTIDSSTEKWLDKLEKKLDYHTWYCGTSIVIQVSVRSISCIMIGKKLENER